MEKHSFHGPGGFELPRGSRVAHIIGWAFLGVAFAVVFALVFGIVVQLLWNWLMPAIFGLGEISYWQAFGIVILSKLLFGAIGHRHREHAGHLHKRFPDRRENFHTDKEHNEMLKNWEHYKQYWREEGKQAFEDYLHRMRAQKEEESDR